MKTLLKTLAGCVVLAGTLCACDKDDDKVPSNLYQQYEVLVESGSASAFANMRQGGANGERVNIGDRLTVNTLPMFYEKPVTATEPEYTYFATLAANHEQAVFRFKNSDGKTLVNTSDFGALSAVTPVNNSLYEVHAGDMIAVALNGAPRLEVKAYLVGTSALSVPMELPLMDSPDLTHPKVEVKLPDVSGVYDLVFDRIHVTPVTQGDGSASGEVKTVIRTRRPVKFG